MDVRVSVPTESVDRRFVESTPDALTEFARRDGACSNVSIDAVHRCLATKLMGAWLANRRQTLMPHTLNFRALASHEVALVIEIMAAAAHADGGVDEQEERQITLALKLVDADANEAARYREAINDPRPMQTVLDAVRSARVGAHAYAGALLTINRSSPVNRAFLAYLAARLGLPPDLALALESRYRT